MSKMNMVLFIKNSLYGKHLMIIDLEFLINYKNSVYKNNF